MKNSGGGLAPQSAEEQAIYRKVDLVTLPKFINGVNCCNCKWVLKRTSGEALCTNPAVNLPVNEHMCCNLWDAPGTIRY